MVRKCCACFNISHWLYPKSPLISSLTIPNISSLLQFTLRSEWKWVNEFGNSFFLPDQIFYLIYYLSFILPGIIQDIVLFYQGVLTKTMYFIKPCILHFREYICIIMSNSLTIFLSQNYKMWNSSVVWINTFEQNPLQFKLHAFRACLPSQFKFS